MAPKNTNAKKEQGKARKAENETKKGAVAAANAVLASVSLFYLLF